MCCVWCGTLWLKISNRSFFLWVFVFSFLAITVLCTCWITTCWLLSSTAAKRVFFELPREAVQYDHVTDSRETKYFQGDAVSVHQLAIATYLHDGETRHLNFLSMKFTDLFLGQNRSQVLHLEFAWHHSPRQAAALLQGLRALEASHLLAPPGCRNVRCRAFRAFPGCDDIVRLDRFWSAGLLSFAWERPNKLLEHGSGMFWSLAGSNPSTLLCRHRTVDYPIFIQSIENHWNISFPQVKPIHFRDVPNLHFRETIDPSPIFFTLKNNGFPMNITKESFLSQAPTLRQQASVVEMLEWAQRVQISAVGRRYPNRIGDRSSTCRCTTKQCVCTHTVT